MKNWQKILATKILATSSIELAVRLFNFIYRLSISYQTTMATVDES